MAHSDSDFGHKRHPAATGKDEVARNLPVHDDDSASVVVPTISDIIAKAMPKPAEFIGGITVAFHPSATTVRWHSRPSIFGSLPVADLSLWDHFETRILRIVNDIIHDEDWASADWIVEGRREGHLLLLAFGLDFLDFAGMDNEKFRIACLKATDRLKKSAVIRKAGEPLVAPSQLPRQEPLAVWTDLTFIRELFYTPGVPQFTSSKRSTTDSRKVELEALEQTAFSGTDRLSAFVAGLSAEDRAELVAQLQCGDCPRIDPLQANADELSTYLGRLSSQPDTVRTLAISELSRVLQVLGGRDDAFGDKRKISEAIRDARKRLGAQILYEGEPCTLSAGSEPKYGNGQYRISRKGGAREPIHSPTRFPSGLSAVPGIEE